VKIFRRTTSQYQFPFFLDRTLRSTHCLFGEERGLGFAPGTVRCVLSMTTYWGMQAIPFVVSIAVDYSSRLLLCRTCVPGTGLALRQVRGLGYSILRFRPSMAGLDNQDHRPVSGKSGAPPWLLLLSHSAGCAANSVHGSPRWHEAGSTPLPMIDYHKDGGTWEYHSRLPVRARTRLAQTRFQRNGNPCNVSALPGDLHIATVQQASSFWECTGFGPALGPHPILSPLSLLQRFQQAGPGTEWALRDLSITDNGRTIAEAIRLGSCIALSDGSVKDGVGSAAWVLEGANSQHRIMGFCQVPGDASDQCSYRSEYAGLYALALAIRLICEHYQIGAGSVTVCCDGLGPLTRASHLDWLTHPGEQCYDLKEATRFQLSRSPLQWRFHHVRGHQDSRKPVSSLDRYERLNCEMDSRAKAYRSSLMNSPSVWLVEGEPWPVWVGDKKISSDLPKVLQTACSGPPALAYWQGKGRFGSGSPDMVDWQHQERAIKATTASRVQFMSKHASGFCGVGKKMVQMGFWNEAKCCRCGFPVEDSEHVSRCSQPEASRVWDGALSTLERHLNSVKTDPRLVEIILQALRTWRSGGTPPTTHSNPLIQAALQDQAALGWRSFLEGLPCNKWT
jgi:hypothetical protein